MKKLTLFIVVVGLIVVSCETRYYSVVVKNNSSKNVSYSYDGLHTTLAPLDFKTYEVAAHTQMPSNIVDQNDIASLKMERVDDQYIFTDATPLTLNVINSLPSGIPIMADNYIDNGGSKTLSLNANSEGSAIIYTKNPNFSTTSNYDVIFDWEVNGNVMSLIIR